MGTFESGWGIGSLLFAEILVIHILLWRYFPSSRRYPVLFLLFLVFPQLAWWHSATAFWVTFCLALNYLAIFPAFQASSPTLVMLNHLLQKPGLSESMLRDVFKSGVLIERLGDLRDGGFVRESSGRLQLSRRGKFLAGIFRYYRNLLGLPVGDGG